MDDKDLRIEELEERFDSLVSRYSALEWIVEQHFSLFLLGMQRDDAESFLNAISHPDVPAFRVTEVGEEGVPPDAAALLDENIAHIAEKVRTRLRQGMRRR